MSRPTSLSGPSGPIVLDRDENGVALIRAGSSIDALRGLGYCHARDRGLQMLFVRILGRGQASRWLEATDKMLAIDKYFRRLDFLGDVETEFAALTPSARAAVEAYSAGVNTYFEESGLPWELRLLGYHKAFEPWTFADSVLTGKVIGYVSLGATQGEIERWIVDCVRAGVPVPALEELFRLTRLRSLATPETGLTLGFHAHPQKNNHFSKWVISQPSYVTLSTG